MPESSTANARAKLTELIRQKQYLIENLEKLEHQIYSFEGNYLEDTAPYGNIIKGWDRYLVTATGSVFSAAAGANGPGEKRVRKFRDSDRIFSRSSATSMQYSSNPRNHYDQDKRESPPAGEVYSANQHFEDRVSENDPKVYSPGPTAKKKRRHR
ncbi:hypothetical protein Aperf_G00000066698 [Anoplocephala perfoliata]